MPSPGSGDPQISLLYVDDEPVLLEIGKEFLESRAGFRVDTQETAIDALEELTIRSYDAIVSEYQMPGMDGIAFLRALREKGDTTPYIIFTGKGREEVVIEAFEAGADFYIQKGGDPKSQFAELERKVRRAVDLHRAENTIRASEEKYRTLVDRASQMLFLHDQHGKILDVNQKAVQYTGYSREELLSMNVSDIDPDADRREDIQWLWKESPFLEERIFEVRHQRRDGSIYPAEVHATRVIIAGNPCIMALATDISSRKQEEARLRESEEKYRLIAENTADTIWIVDLNLNIRYISPSVLKMHGYTPEEVMGQSLREMLTPGSIDSVLKRFAEEMALEATGKADPDRTIPIEFEKYRKDGSTILVENAVRFLRDPDGRPTGIIGVSRDITERWKMERASIASCT